jgi:hypothetical protein
MRDRCEFNLFERIRWRHFASFLFFVFLLLPARTDMASGLETFAHALTRHHIELTEAALIEALRNPDNEVRDATAIPYLRMAIQAEKEDYIKSQMETSLHSLIALPPKNQNDYFSVAS